MVLHLLSHAAGLHELLDRHVLILDIFIHCSTMNLSAHVQIAQEIINGIQFTNSNLFKLSRVNRVTKLRLPLNKSHRIV